jgi:hypothetical protein
MPKSGAALESPLPGKPQATASKQLSPLLRSVLILRFGAGWKLWQKKMEGWGIKSLQIQSSETRLKFQPGLKVGGG